MASKADFDELLIEAVKNRPAIWKTDCTEYKDRDLKAKSWSDIAAVLNISGKSCYIKHFLIVFQIPGTKI